MDIIILAIAYIRHRKSNFVSIIVLMMIVSSILSTVISIDHNISQRAIESNDAVGTGDIVSIISDDYFTEEMRSSLDNSRCIKSTKVINAFTSSDTAIDGTTTDYLIYYTPFDPQTSCYKIFNSKMSGFVENPAPFRDGEIYMPVSMKNNYLCKKGSTVSLKLQNETLNFTIAGFVEEPLSGTDIIKTKNFFITENDFNKIYAESSPSFRQTDFTTSTARIKLVHIYSTEKYKNNITELCKKINRETDIDNYSIFLDTRNLVQNCILILPKIICGAMYTFLVLLIFIVILVFSNNINTSIEIDYVNIGILKSQGLSRRKIRLVIILQNLLPAAIGSFIGLIISAVIIANVKDFFSNMSCLLISGNVLFGRSLLILLAIFLLICIFIYVKTAKISKVSSARAISGGLSDIHFSSILNTTVLSKSKAFFGIRLSWRQYTSNFRQYTSICFIISFLVFFVSTCLSFSENFSETFYDEMYGTISADVCVNYGDHTDISDEVEQDINSISTVSGSFSYDEILFDLDENSYYAQILDDTSFIKYFISGKEPTHNNEILLTNSLSKSLNKKTGDKVQIQHGSYSGEFIVCGIYDSLCMFGKTFMITFDGAKILYPELVPQKKYYILSDSSKAGLINDTINKKFEAYGIHTESGKKQNDNTLHKVVSSANTIITVLYIISVLFAIIIIWLVCNKSFARERTDIGIYMAYGFTSFRLKMQFCLKYLIIGFIGSILGMILFILFGDMLNTATLSTTGITKFDAPLSATSLFISPALILVFIFISAYFTLNKLKTVTTKELIVE